MSKIVVFAQQKWRSVTAKRFWTKIEGRDVPRTEIFLAGVVGIEPTSKVLETPILPLNHTPIETVQPQ